MIELWNDCVAGTVISRCSEADKDSDKVQNFVDFAHEVIASSKQTDAGFIGSGLYCPSVQSDDIVVTQQAIQLWARKRNLKVSQRALKESARELHDAGLDIEKEPKPHRCGGETVWGVSCTLKIRDLKKTDTITDTYEDILTDTHNILTELYRDKNNKNNENVSINEAEPPVKNVETAQPTSNAPQEKEGVLPEKHPYTYNEPVSRREKSVSQDVSLTGSEHGERQNEHKR